MQPNDPVSALKGVGTKRASALQTLDIYTVADLLLHAPFRYEDRSRITALADLEAGSFAVVRARVTKASLRPTRNRSIFMAALDVEDDSGAASALLFGPRYLFTNLPEPSSTTVNSILIAGVPEPTRGLMEFRSPEYRLNADDEEKVGEWNRIIPIYPTTAALPRKWLAAVIYRVVTANDFHLPEVLPEAIVKKRNLPSLTDALRYIHAPSDMAETQAGKRRMAYQELYFFQLSLARERAKRQKNSAPELSAGTELRKSYERSLPFTLTKFQQEAINEISADLLSPTPMHRLLQGDVGSGKTAVALAAAAQCCGAGRQTAILTPTTILCEQFFANAKRYLQPLGLNCALLTGGMPPKARRELLESLQLGEIDVIVGTHALLSDDVTFASPGLIIIDEQHRFGVKQRQAIIEKTAGAKPWAPPKPAGDSVPRPRIAGQKIEKTSLFSQAQPEKINSISNLLPCNTGVRGTSPPAGFGAEPQGFAPHTLMMSATPIPRSLCLAFYGDIDITLIREKPAGRKPVATKVVSDNHLADVYAFISDRIVRGALCYWVCSSIGADWEESEDQGASSVTARCADIQKKLGNIKAAPLHGKMSADQKAAAIADFASGQTPLLVSTTVIEVGVDVPDASVMVVESATSFGLSQLHQLRGRVGRGKTGAVCILLDSARNIAQNERLHILKNSHDGFQIAEQDLKLRGAGELTGLRQHGHEVFNFANPAADNNLLLQVREDIGFVR